MTVPQTRQLRPARPKTCAPPPGPRRPELRPVAVIDCRMWSLIVVTTASIVSRGRFCVEAHGSTWLRKRPSLAQ